MSCGKGLRRLVTLLPEKDDVRKDLAGGTGLTPQYGLQGMGTLRCSVFISPSNGRTDGGRTAKTSPSIQMIGRTELDGWTDGRGDGRTDEHTVAVVKLFLKCDINLNTKDSDGQTALWGPGENSVRQSKTSLGMY